MIEKGREGLFMRYRVPMKEAPLFLSVLKKHLVTLYWADGRIGRPPPLRTYLVVDLKVLDSIVYDDDPEHIKISFGESFFSSWRK